MKQLIFILAFFPLLLFGQRDTVITEDLGYVVDSFNIQVVSGDTTVYVVYFNEDTTRKDEIRYYEKSPSAKATMAVIYDELLASLPQLSASCEAAYSEYQRRNTALINRRRQFEAIRDVMETFFGY